MRGVPYRAEGHHVDDAGNLISCVYVDFRDAAERSPITSLQKALSKRPAIPGCGTIRLSKLTGFGGRGEGLTIGPEAGTAAGAADPDALYCGRNAWIYSASVEPETQGEQAAWREALPAGYDAVSPIRRPRAFARALGAMAAEQASPRGRSVLLRSAAAGEAFSTAHRRRPVGPGRFRSIPVSSREPARACATAASRRAHSPT